MQLRRGRKPALPAVFHRPANLKLELFSRAGQTERGAGHAGERDPPRRRGGAD